MNKAYYYAILTASAVLLGQAPVMAQKSVSATMSVTLTIVECSDGKRCIGEPDPAISGPVRTLTKSAARSLKSNPATQIATDPETGISTITLGDRTFRATFPE